ncbi:MAG: penicillin-binding protein activator [Myxococcales bacterium]|nr:penicillin-binding protein activator [Myxococcales bacterium]
MMSTLALLAACGGRRDRPVPPVKSERERQDFEAAVAAFEAGNGAAARRRFEVLLKSTHDPVIRPYATYYLARLEGERRPASAAEALLAQADAGAPPDLRWLAAVHGSAAAARAGQCKRVRPEASFLAEQLRGAERAEVELSLAKCAEGAEAIGHLAAAAKADPARETEARAAAEKLLAEVRPDREMMEAWPALFEGQALPTEEDPPPEDTPVVAGEAGERVHVGVLVPLSGNLRPLGEQLALGLEALQSNEDRPGASPGPVLLIRDASQPEDLPAAFDAFVEEGVFGVVGLFDKAVAPAAAQAAAERGVPLVMLTSSDVATAVEGPVWRALHTPGLVARTAAGAGLMRGGRRAAVLRPDNSYGRTLGSWFSQSWQAGGGEVDGEVVWDANKPDWARVAKKVKGIRADTLFVPCDARAAAQLLSHLAAEGTWVRGVKSRFKAPPKDARELWLIGTPEWYAPSLLTQARRYAEGVMVPVPFALETARGAAFDEQLRRRTEASATAFDALFADVIGAFQVARDRAVKEKLGAVEALTRTRYDQGHTAGLDFGERDAVQALFLMVVEEGRFTPMQ